MRMVFFCIACMMLSVTAGGCSWVGQTAGKAQAKIERKAQAVEQGYEKGYSEEKAKTAPEENTEAAADGARI